MGKRKRIAIKVTYRPEDVERIQRLASRGDNTVAGTVRALSLEALGRIDYTGSSDELPWSLMTNLVESEG